MSEGWRDLTLGDVCQFENGDRGKNYPGRKAFTLTGIPFINAGHLNDGVIDWGSMNFIPEEHFQRIGNGKIKIGDLLFCLRGSLGKFAVVDRDTKGAIASSLVIIRPTDHMDPGYLAAYFRSNICSSMIDRYSNGAAQPNLSAKCLKSFEIPLPPLPEQKRIVAILDEAFAGIDTVVANTEKNLANARELFESYLNSVFSQRGEGWITKPLGECFRLRSGDGLTTKQMRPGEFPVFGGNGIAGSHDQSNLSGSNVIIGRVGALCGNARHINESIWLTDNAFKVVDKRYSVDDRFLVCLLNACNLRQYARQAAQPVISNSSLKAINLNFPESESEQRKIVGQLDELKKEIHRVASVYQQKLTALAELKQSLLQKAFSGELTASKAEAAVEEATA